MRIRKKESMKIDIKKKSVDSFKAEADELSKYSLDISQDLQRLENLVNHFIGYDVVLKSINEKDLASPLDKKLQLIKVTDEKGKSTYKLWGQLFSQNKFQWQLKDLGELILPEKWIGKDKIFVSVNDKTIFDILAKDFPSTQYNKYNNQNEKQIFNQECEKIKQLNELNKTINQLKANLNTLIDMADKQEKAIENRQSEKKKKSSQKKKDEKSIEAKWKEKELAKAAKAMKITNLAEEHINQKHNIQLSMEKINGLMANLESEIKKVNDLALQKLIDTYFPESKEVFSKKTQIDASSRPSIETGLLIPSTEIKTTLISDSEEVLPEVQGIMQTERVERVRDDVPLLHRSITDNKYEEERKKGTTKLIKIESQYSITNSKQSFYAAKEKKPDKKARNFEKTERVKTSVTSLKKQKTKLK